MNQELSKEQFRLNSPLNDMRFRSFSISARDRSIGLNDDVDRSSWFLKALEPEDRIRLAQGLALRVPLHLEVHPYHFSQEAPCSNLCQHCTKGDDRADLRRLKLTGIEPERLKSLIMSLAGSGIGGVVLSGNSTEPMLYPWIEDTIRTIKEANLRFRLYSNFHYGSKIVPLASILGKRDVIRVSLDAASSEAYDAVHHPIIKEAFPRILKNIEMLADERAKCGTEFSIGIAFLLTRLNSNEADIAALVDWARAKRVDWIRFTVPLLPLIGNDSFDAAQQLSVSEVDSLRSFLNGIKEKYPDYAENILVMNDDPDLPEKPFRFCHHWKAVAMLGATGRFFPCTSMSLARLKDELGLGNVNDPQFDFWKFWNDAEKWSCLQAQICAAGVSGDCTRYEYAVNEQIENLIGTH